MHEVSLLHTAIGALHSGGGGYLELTHRSILRCCPSAHDRSPRGPKSPRSSACGHAATVYDFPARCSFSRRLIRAPLCRQPYYNSRRLSVGSLPPARQPPLRSARKPRWRLWSRRSTRRWGDGCFAGRRFSSTTRATLVPTTRARRPPGGLREKQHSLCHVLGVKLLFVCSRVTTHPSQHLKHHVRPHATNRPPTGRPAALPGQRPRHTRAGADGSAAAAGQHTLPGGLVCRLVGKVAASPRPDLDTLP